MLIKCPECGKEISDQAVSCPNCGVKIRGTSTVKIRFNVHKTFMFGAATGPKLTVSVDVSDSSGKNLWSGKSGSGNTCVLHNITERTRLNVKVGKSALTVHGDFSITVEPGKNYVCNSRYGNQLGGLKDYTLNEVDVIDSD